MKIIFYYIVILTLTSCCFGNRKCPQDNKSTIFRLVDKTTGADLVFGPTGLYNKDSIAFFSLTGTDTVFHNYGAGPNSSPGQDSLLFVSFDHRNFETMFLRLNSLDVDTLRINYEIIDAGPCCNDYTNSQPLSYNNNPVKQIQGGVTALMK